MGLVAFFCITVLLSTVAIKVVASLVGGAKSDWLISVIAAVLTLIVQTAVGNIVPNVLLGVAISVFVVGFVLESVLATDFLKAGIIAIAAVAGYWLVTVGFSYLGIDTSIASLIEQIN